MSTLWLEYTLLNGEYILGPAAGGTPYLFLLLGAIAASCSVTVVLIGLGRSILRLYAATIGSRSVQAKKLRRLACGVRAGYIEDELGSAALLDSWHGDDGKLHMTRRTYILPDVVVQLLCSADDVVESFVISTLHRRFAPKLEIPWGGGKKDKSVLRLGRTRYDVFERGSIQQAGGWAGARHWGYHELHYFGNPGFYQSYILASTDLTDIGWPQSDTEWESIFLDPRSGEIDTSSPPSWWPTFRRSGAPNTLAVVGPHADAGRFTSMIGLDSDALRIIPAS